MASKAQRRMLEIGDRAPEVTFRTPGGKPVTMLDLLSESGVMLAFFKVSCPVCQYTLPFLERIHKGGAATSIKFYAISQDDAEATAEFADEFGVTFPSLIDDERSYQASNAFGISMVPTMFLVSQDRTIQWTSAGFSREDLEDLALRMDTKVFRAGESVPDFRPG